MIKFLKDKKYNVSFPQRKEENAGVDFFLPMFNKAFLKSFEEKNPMYYFVNMKNYSKDFSYGNQMLLLEGDDEKGIINIPPQSSVIIPSGFYTKFPENISLIGHPRSSMGSKMIVMGACVDDSSYQGMLFINLINVGEREQQINSGDKIAQFVPHFIDSSPIQCFDELSLSKGEFFEKVSSRGDGAFGSTGR